MTNSKKIFGVAGMLFVLSLIFGSGNLQASWYNYLVIPLGGSNILGTYSPAGTALGETVFGVQGPQAGFLNPASLRLNNKTEFAYVHRLTDSLYRFSFNSYYDSTLIKKFSRITQIPEWAGGAISFRGWQVAVSYSTTEEYNYPELIYYWSESSYTKQSQSGKLQSINLAIACPLTSTISAGISFSYRTGKINHRFFTFYTFRDTEGIEEKYGLKGMAVNFGFIWKPNEKLALGIAFRPPVKMKVDLNFKGEDYGYEGKVDGYYQLPLAIIISTAVRLNDRFFISGDLSLWRWKQVFFNLPYGHRSLLPYDLRTNPACLKLGLEYDTKLSRGYLKGLKLRCGYIHDPQIQYGYQQSVGNYFTGGFGMDFGKLVFESAVKVPIMRVPEDFIHTTFFQTGLKFRF